MKRPNPVTITELIDQANDSFASNIAIIDGDVRLDYQSLAEACHMACRAFIEAGINKGDRAAIWAPNIYEWIIATIGLQLAGGVLVPINTRLKGSEAAYILNASQAKILLTVSGFLSIDYLELLAKQELPYLESTIFLRGESSGGIAWEQFLTQGEAVASSDARIRSNAIQAEDPLDILFTSGTTGRPKGVISSHGQNLCCYMAWGERIGLLGDDKYLIINPFYHSFGYKAGWLTCLLYGAAILPAITFDVAAVMKTIQEEKVSVMPGPPTIFETIISEPSRENYDISSLRLVTTGATTVPVRLVERIREELGIEDVRTAYGLTESCGVVSVTRRNDPAKLVATTSGCPLPDVEIKCIDTSGNIVPIGEPGEILIRGYNVMSGYLDNPIATGRAIDNEGWLHTEDLGVIDDNGYIQIMDRLNDMFIVGGFNCYPAEVEQKIAILSGVDQVAVVGAGDQRLGEVGHAFIVREVESSLTEESVLSDCKEMLANYKVPRYITFLEALPRNSLGKVMKNILADRSQKLLSAIQ